MTGLIWEPPLATAPGLATATGQFAWRASYSVQVAWQPTLAGWFLLNRSALDGIDEIAPARLIVPAFDGAYDDLNRFDGGWPVHVQSLTWQRGRDQTLETVQAGTATVTVSDKNGLLNPRNETSPIHAATGKPGWFVRIRAKTQGGDWAGQFLGFLRALDYQPAPRGGTATIEADDLFVRLDRDDPTIPTVTETTTGGAIGRILDHFGWTDPDYLSLDAGDKITGYQVPEKQDSGLSLIEQLLATELGLFYIDGDGIAVFENRTSRARKRDPDRVVSGSMRAVGPGTSLDRIINEATFTKTDSTPQTYTDKASADPVRGYGLAAAGDVESDWLRDDEAALERATYVVNSKKDPGGPLWNLNIDNREQALVETMVHTEISALLQVSEEETGTAGSFFVERVQRTVSFGPYTDTASYVLSDQGPLAFALDVSQLAPFLLDFSLLDGADGLDLAPPQPPLDVLAL